MLTDWTSETLGGLTPTTAPAARNRLRRHRTARTTVEPRPARVRVRTRSLAVTGQTVVTSVPKAVSG
ncbi:hypothetical protein [Streptomyces sp. NPDC002082]|uniref:hypothetical protein n=1 Tax=Streptomyces sp. NPDC002082 TaxID=3154772 RepID=UPI00331A6859